MIWYILLYSVVGFGLEVAFARLTHARKRDRKCMLFLPMCPVYGLGAAGILALPPAVQTRPWLLLPAAALITTAAEYLMSLFYERLWHVSFWDYRALPGNLNGRVCLPFSVAWGLLSLPLVFWLQPAVAPLVAALPDLLLVPVMMIFAVDFFLTGHLLRQTENTDSLKWYA